MFFLIYCDNFYLLIGVFRLHIFNVFTFMLRFKCDFFVIFWVFFLIFVLFYLLSSELLEHFLEFHFDLYIAIFSISLCRDS